jgi:hypothetical protein
MEQIETPPTHVAQASNKAVVFEAFNYDRKTNTITLLFENAIQKSSQIKNHKAATIIFSFQKAMVSDPEKCLDIKVDGQQVSTNISIFTNSAAVKIKGVSPELAQKGEEAGCILVDTALAKEIA